MPAPRSPASRVRAIAALLPVLALTLFLGTGEAVLRFIFRDNGKTTLGGPGPRSFVHDTVEGTDLRGRMDQGPKPPGAVRIMALGDSITWGLGVRDWRKTWPEQLVLALERAGIASQMADLSYPGRGVTDHLAELIRWAGPVSPDVIVYQWYVNDIEVVGHRPPTAQWWQRGAMHKRLRSGSYLYFVLDDRVSRLIPPVRPTYQDYLLSDFRPGSRAWAEFERHFHSLSERAREVAPRRLLFLYPQVPFRDTNPLEPIHARMRGMAVPHRLAIPLSEWTVAGGAVTDQAGAAWGQVADLAADSPSSTVTTPVYYFSPGSTRVTLRYRSRAAPGADLGELALREAVDGTPLASVRVMAAVGATGDWRESSVDFPVAGPAGHSARIVWSNALGAGISLAAIDIHVDYGWQVLDLSEPLNTFDTHASLFDSHPNERAHLAVAGILADALRPHR